MAWEGPIRDGSIETWAAGAPVHQNSQATNTTLFQLRRDLRPNHPQALVFPELVGVSEDLVKDGQSALRATLAAAAVADAFRIWNPGAIVAALTGASTNALIVRLGRRHFFSFYARNSVDGNLLRLRLWLRNAANAIQGSSVADATDTTVVRYAGRQLQPVDGTNTYVELGMSRFWRKYAVTFDVPPTMGNATPDHIVWQLSNGTAAAQVIDLDGIEYGTVDQQEEM